MTFYMTESTPLFAQPQPSDVLQNAKFTLARYRAYSGDDYLTKMSNMLDTRLYELRMIKK